MERETGIEPATNGLEGRVSATELLPLVEPIGRRPPGDGRSLAEPGENFKAIAARQVLAEPTMGNSGVVPVLDC